MRLLESLGIIESIKYSFYSKTSQSLYDEDKPNADIGFSNMVSDVESCESVKLLEVADVKAKNLMGANIVRGLIGRKFKEGYKDGTRCNN